MLQSSPESFWHVFPHCTEESHHRFSATEVTNKTLAAEMQELRARLTEAEETARAAERQKSQLQRLLQEFRRRLTPLQLEMQRMVEKVSRGGVEWLQLLLVKLQKPQRAASCHVESSLG